MRICRITDQFPPEPGGLAQGLLELSLEQHRRGHELVVITRPSPRAAPLDADLPFPVVRLGAPNRLLLGFRALARARRFRPDVVHTHGTVGAPWALLPGWLRPPWVASIHSLRRIQYPLRYDLEPVVAPVRAVLGAGVDRTVDRLTPGSAYVRREFLLERLVCRRASALALVAPYMEPVLRRRFGVPAARLRVVGNGAAPGATPSPDEPPADLLEELGCEPGDRLILCVGRQTWLKRFHLPLMGLARIAERHPEARLVLVGGGPLEPTLKALASALLVTPQVRHVPWLPQERLLRLYRCASGLALPSLSEGLPKVLLEAMACGLPVVASAIPPHRDLLERGRLGLLVERPSRGAWAEALAELLAGPGTEDRRQAALGAVEASYRWRHVADRLDRLQEALR